jgi:hypothetical protein
MQRIVTPANERVSRPSDVARTTTPSVDSYRVEPRGTMPDRRACQKAETSKDRALRPGLGLKAAQRFEIEHRDADALDPQDVLLLQKLERLVRSLPR